jgi:hypothetical protein
MSGATLFDTDMLLHRYSPDDTVREAAHQSFQVLAAQISEFSKVEFKGAFIRDVMLVRHKVAKATSLKQAVSRALDTGGRRPARMIGQLVSMAEDSGLPLRPWAPLQKCLLCLLDAHIGSAWAFLSEGTLDVVSTIQCDRAAEPPEFGTTGWVSTIPLCTPENTTCRVEGFLRDNLALLQALVAEVDSNQVTDEVKAILVAANEVIVGRFHWEGSRCRSIGDLLIGLHASSAKLLVTSNHKEHLVLSSHLGYSLQLFPLVQLRKK